MSYTRVMQILRVDCGAGTYLPLCQACAWRGPVEFTRTDAMARADRHARDAHPGSRAARDAWSTRRARAAA